MDDVKNHDKLDRGDGADWSQQTWPTAQEMATIESAIAAKAWC